MTHSDSDTEAPQNRPSPDWEALARHVAGESTPDESARIEAWLAANPREREILTTLDQAIARMARDVPANLDVDGALASVKARFGAEGQPLALHRGGSGKAPPTRTFWRVPFPAIAAAGLLVVGAGSWLALRDGRSIDTQPAARMLATGVGIRDSLTLPDGSRVVLGPMSSVALRSGYGSSARQVEVNGDAWFDVIHDEGMPFTVHAGGATIVDFGTKFTVQRRADDGISVNVTEGSVSLRGVNAPAAQGVILNAGDNGLLGKDGQVVASRGSVTDDDTAWLSGRLVFRETPVAEVVTSLHRWYGVRIQIAGASLASRRVTATFGGETPERMLEVLGLVLGGEIERHGDSVVVRPREGRTQSR